jgi:O-antigen/teichoic acid export membrane protein
MTSPVLWLCSAMLANQPSGYAQLGIFAAATQWRNAVAFFPTVISNATLPILASVRATAQPLAYRGALIRNLTMALLSATMVAVPLAVWPHKLMGVYGTDFTTGSSVLVISAITGVLNSANAMVGTGIAAEAAMWWGFTFNCLWAAVLLLCARVLVPTGLALGLAEALLLAYLSHTVWQGTYLVLRVTNRDTRSQCLAR